MRRSTREMGPQGGDILGLSGHLNVRGPVGSNRRIASMNRLSETELSGTFSIRVDSAGAAVLRSSCLSTATTTWTGAAFDMISGRLPDRRAALHMSGLVDRTGARVVKTVFGPSH